MVKSRRTGDSPEFIRKKMRVLEDRYERGQFTGKKAEKQFQNEMKQFSRKLRDAEADYASDGVDDDGVGFTNESRGISVQLNPKHVELLLDLLAQVEGQLSEDDDDDEEEDDDDDEEEDEYHDDDDWYDDSSSGRTSNDDRSDSMNPNSTRYNP